MATNEERRRVAEALRAKYRERTEGRTFGPQCLEMQYEAYLRDLESCLPDGESMFTVLADLIEPSCDASATRTDATATRDVSQSRRDTVACNPTGRGIDSIYEWCFERLEGADGDEDELYCSIMCAIEDYRHPELATAHTVRAVDREALLALADEMEIDGAGSLDDGDWCKPLLEEYARRIREALGVSDD